MRLAQTAIERQWGATMVLTEQRLRASEENLRALAAHLQSVREEERIHIAREIHDELGQALTGLKYDIGALVKAAGIDLAAENGVPNIITFSGNRNGMPVWLVRAIAKAYTSRAITRTSGAPDLLARDGPDRRAAQYVLARLHDNLARLLAPLIPHTAEELWAMLGHAGGLASTTGAATAVLDAAALHTRAVALGTRYAHHHATTLSLLSLADLYDAQRNPRLARGEHLRGVFALSHYDYPAHHVVLVVLAGDPFHRYIADVHLGDVLDEHRGSVVSSYDNALNFLGGAQQRMILRDYETVGGIRIARTRRHEPEGGAPSAGLRARFGAGIEGAGSNDFFVVVRATEPGVPLRSTSPLSTCAARSIGFPRPASSVRPGRGPATRDRRRS